MSGCLSCVDRNGVVYTLANSDTVRCESRLLWMKKSIQAEVWVCEVIKQFESNPKCSVMAFDCIVNWPMLLQLNGQLHICGQVLDINFLFDVETTQRSIVDQVGGYDQELVIVKFLEQRYFKQNVAQGLFTLKCDLQYMYQLSLFRKCVHPCMKYLHDRVCGGTTVMDIIRQVSWLPIHPDISHAVFEFGRWLNAISKWNIYKSTDILIQMMAPLFVESASEWKVIEICKQLCGTPWRKHFVHGPVNVQYGHCSWEWDWKTTHVSFEGKIYFERIDERIQWLSVWQKKISTESNHMRESPKHLLAIVANAMR